MCGICGQLTWGPSARVDEGLIQRMNKTITHRGPDDDGFYFDHFASGSVGLAMRRLSIIDLATGKQPISNETDDVTVVYNGEIYNFQELRSDLQSKGHQFKTQSDTEVIVHGYEVWGDEVAHHLNGMFGFALWDKKKQKLILARDRMGIKPLYYHIGKDKLAFGSEIKTILQDPQVSKEIDPGAVDDYLSMRFIPTPKSIYKSIRKLEPATMLIWEKGNIRFKRYWNYVPTETRDYGINHYLEKLDGLMEDSVKRQMISEVPLGTFLSGGLDSPAITYYAKKHKKDLMSFNIYFSEKTFSEREQAKEVAQFLGTNHKEQEVSPDILDTIPKLVDCFDEPFGDDSMVPTFFLTKMARQHMTVALSGDGGDELFGGYPTYIADRVASYYRMIPRFLTRGILEPIVYKIPASYARISFDYKAKAFVAAAQRTSPLEHFGWTEIFSPKIKKKLYSKSFTEMVAERPLAENFVHAYADGASREGWERFLYVDQKTHLLDEFLVKVDRLSMWHSLEVRPPFLDHRIVEFAAEVPWKYKIRGWTTKYLVRRLMKGRLPEGIIKGFKKGFSPPTATWLATDLLEYARRKFSPQHLDDIPFLDNHFAGELLENHVQRRTNLGRRLWTLLMFVEWYDRKILGRD